MAGLFLLMTGSIWWGCGDKLSIPEDLPEPNYKGGAGDTNYIQITPAWTSAGGIEFDRPNDVYIGYDQLIYICDTYNDRVVKLDLDGTFLEVYSIVHPVAITQDRGLDLLAVCGDYFRATIGTDGQPDTIWYGSSVYRRRYLSTAGFEEVFAAEYPYHMLIIRPGRDTVWLAAEFWGIAASPDADKNYFVADFWKERVIRFGPDDKPIPPDFITSGVGLGLTYQPSDLFTYQIVGRSYLAYTSTDDVLGTQIVSMINGRPVFDDTTAYPDLLLTNANSHRDIAVDEFSNFYVLFQTPNAFATAKNFFYKFNRYGERLLAFGGTAVGSGDKQFRRPAGIAVREGIVYIADTGNNRIVRYQQSTEARQ